MLGGGMRRFEHSSRGGDCVARSGEFEDVAWAQYFVSGWHDHFGIAASDRQHHGAAVGVEIQFGQFFADTFAVGSNLDRRDHPYAGDFV